MKKTKAKSISIVLIVFILLIGLSLVINASTINNPTTIEFADKALYEKVVLELTTDNIKINQNKDDETLKELEIRISADDIEKITELSLQGVTGSQIQNLTGLERFTSLNTLNLSGNAITTMSMICDLNIQDLNMTGNIVNEEILTSISNLTTLTTLNMSNTKLDNLETFTPLINLQTLIISGNNLNTLSPIAGLPSITKLDISNNRSIPTIGHIVGLENLKYLNITNTGLTSLNGIQEFKQLEELYASNIIGLQKDNNRLDALYSLDEEDNACLKNLKILDLSNSGITETTDSEGNVIQTANQAKVDFEDLAILSTLEELHLENMGIKDLGGLANLENLKKIDLANNKIDSDALEDIIIMEKDEVVQENVLKATHIELQYNDIIDISIFSKYPANIQYLDLRGNHIYNTTPLANHDLSERIDLRKQNITFSVYDKKVEVDHYIILPEIFKSNKKEGSIVYSEDNFTTTGLELNQNYIDSDTYNVIIDSAKTNNDTLSIKINGGNADGTILTYVIGQSSSKSHNEYVTESLYFNDDNFYQTMVNEINNDPQGQGYEKYIEKSFEVVPQKIININRQVIDQMELFYFDNKSIKDITGIENCSKLTDLYLNGNDILTIQPLIGCTELVTLKLANNKNLGNNNSAIETLSDLTYLDLSNTGMTNINSINNLRNNLKTCKLIDLNISDNDLQDINGIEKITTLQKLYIANEQLDNEDLSVIKSLVGLSTLDFSGNQISDISVISGLANLKNLYFNNNEVESLESLAGKVFTELKFAENKVKDITPLSSHNSINKLIMDSNQIEDVTILKDILISEEFSATGQQITRTISEDASGIVSIALPQIFKAARDSENKYGIYTENNFRFTNCELDTTGENVIVNVQGVDSEVAQVQIYQGKAHLTTLTIAIPLIANIQYSIPTDTPTNQNVTATISFNRNNVTIANNEGKNTYTFEENGEFTFEYVDEYGFEGTTTAKVTNIDKVKPQSTEILKEIVNKKVVVTIKVNEPISQPNGWTLADNKLSISKTYESDANETVKLVDLAGNEASVNVQVKIDRVAPVITGVENGKTYNKPVTPVIQDENLNSIKLTKDGVNVSNYQSGTTISETGEYVLTATDKFKNTTTVSFKINVSDIITSTSTSIIITEDETTPIIRGISPKTTVSELMKILKAEMSFEIVDKNGNTVTNASKIGTGYKVKMASGKNYTLIVWGDLNGDGEISISELAAASRVASDPNAKVSDIQLLAIDVSRDGNVKIPDLAVLSRLKNEG